MALIETLAPVIEFFLLSIEEAEHYFPNAEARRVKLIDNEFENFVEKQLEKGILILANKNLVLKVHKHYLFLPRLHYR